MGNILLYIDVDKVMDVDSILLLIGKLVEVVNIFFDFMKFIVIKERVE